MNDKTPETPAKAAPGPDPKVTDDRDLNRSPKPGEKVLDFIRRTIDPTARQLWDVQGPRDGNSRLTGLLVKINGQRDVLIAQRFEPDLTGETFQLYREMDPA